MFLAKKCQRITLWNNWYFVTRVFGLTEYDYLSMNDDDLHNDPDPNEGYLTIADETSSRSQSYSSRMIRVDMSQDEMTIYTYEYLVLQTRKDVCFENFEVAFVHLCSLVEEGF